MDQIVNNNVWGLLLYNRLSVDEAIAYFIIY